MLEAHPAELKVKIEHQSEETTETAAVSLAKAAEEKRRAYWTLKGEPAAEQQRRLLTKLSQIEAAVLTQPN